MKTILTAFNDWESEEDLVYDYSDAMTWAVKTGYNFGLDAAIDAINRLANKPGAYAEHYVDAIKKLKNR